MIFGHKRKNQNAIYLCNNWIYYETHFGELQHVELFNAKCLFGGLQKLTQEERLYLASQYRTARGKRLTDGEMVALKGISVEEHRNIKNGILTKLQAALEEVHETLKEEADTYSMKDFTRAEANGIPSEDVIQEKPGYSMRDFTRFHERAAQ